MINSQSIVDTQTLPGVRLITQNLLASARLFEDDTPWDWTAIEDLATFIEVFCMYDSCWLLGGPFQSDTETQDSEFYGLLKDEHFIELKGLKSANLEPLVKVADKHLRAFIGPTPNTYVDLLSSALDSRITDFGYWPGPDGERDIEIGINFLRSLDDRMPVSDAVRSLIKNGQESVYRGTHFLVRTFLYYAYSDQNEIAFAPDAIRIPILSTILRHEDLLREQILAVLRSSFENFPVLGERKLRKHVPPFAAYIFKQASAGEGTAIKKRKRILEEMQRLRHDLGPMRKELRQTEELARDVARRDELLQAEKKWFDTIEDIKREFGPSPGIINVKRGLGLASNLLGAMLSPWNPAAWASLLGGAGLDVVKDVMSRGPAIEIHKLRTQLPSPKGLRTALDKLTAS